eukprot:TRINITY_DN11175_c0_g2_i1.p1 TRINITY_DN11175_c0_g2~~TRINITY_DN11175_c0_g2_i1.p1  ORF type:complete len:137 (-),score=19.27 TRINITY_DN11175_c0_g2_i1:12-422(-)
MRVMCKFGSGFVKEVTDGLLNALLNNRRARFYMGIAYFANYSYIIPYCDDVTEQLAVFAIQFVTYEDVIDKIFSCDYYLAKINDELERIFTDLKGYLKTKKAAIRFELTAIQNLSLIHICRCRRSTLCRSRWSPYH